MILVTPLVLKRIFRGDPLVTPRDRGRPNVIDRITREPKVKAEPGKRKQERKLHTPRDDQMIAMHRSGMTLQEIGAKFNITRERVRQRLAAHGISRLDGGKTIKRFLSVRDMINEAKVSRGQKELRIFLKTGMTAEQWNKHAKEYGNFSRRGSPYSCFVQQRKNSARRGISWGITFIEWWNIWLESGHWAERGRGKGYCMARYGDSGPYTVGNVYICTVGQNFSDSYLIDHPRRARARGFSLKRYKTKSGDRYIVRFIHADGKREFGGFATKQSAESFALERLGK